MKPYNYSNSYEHDICRLKDLSEAAYFINEPIEYDNMINLLAGDHGPTSDLRIIKYKLELGYN